MTLGQAVPLCRNRYFTGKFMDAEDFATDPDYLLGRHRLHNRLLHAWGVVYGLEVVEHPNEECRSRWVAVEPGLAVDQAGREVVVTERQAVEVVPEDQDAAGAFVLFVRYGEEEVEPVPALYAEGTADPQLRRASRVREVARFEVLAREEVGGQEWPLPDAPADPEAPEADRVALALVTRPAEGGDLQIDTRERREPGAPTRIAEVSWEHGGTLGLDRLKDGLEVTFSRPLRSATAGTGLSGHTFLVHAGSPGGGRDPVPGTVSIDGPGTRGTFQISTDALDALAGRTLYVTLQCDFLLDRRGEAIDGGHLGGRLPGGRGVPGGVFESWLEVTAAAGGGGEDETS